MILTWHEDAEEEYVSAAVYYERQVDGLGERFLEQIEATLARVMAAPLRPRFFENGFRRLRVDRFPYAVIYRVKADAVQILAVAHAKRRPGYWRERAEG
jgi:plasmid stabilization system protein ParE